MKTLKKLLLVATTFSSIGVANALNFDLLPTSASLFLSANTVSTFYGSTGGGAEAGSAASLYSVVVGGDENGGFFVKISFGANPQPVLTSAFIKASNAYLWWDSTDLSGFNSGTFDSITLWNSGVSGQGIGHNTGGKNPVGKNNDDKKNDDKKNDDEAPVWKFHGTSHAGLIGTPGTHDVPDGGTTVMLLGAALSTLGLLRRKLLA